MRDVIFPDGCPRYPRTLVATLLACGRFRHEETVYVSTVEEAMTALLLEDHKEGALDGVRYHPETLKPATSADTERVRGVLLRLSDWIASRLQAGIHAAWCGALDCFSWDPELAHLANLDLAQRHLGKLLQA